MNKEVETRLSEEDRICLMAAILLTRPVMMPTPEAVELAFEIQLAFRIEAHERMVRLMEAENAEPRR